MDHKILEYYCPLVSNTINLIDFETAIQEKIGNGIILLSVFNIFLKSNILLRKMTSYGIKNSLRVSIGNNKENRKFLEVLEKKI